MVPQPVRFDDAKPAASRAAPGLGADAGRVLADLCGVDATELDHLRQNGVVA